MGVDLGYGRSAVLTTVHATAVTYRVPSVGRRQPSREADCR